jgi:hypothetical protein
MRHSLRRSPLHRALLPALIALGALAALTPTAFAQSSSGYSPWGFGVEAGVLSGTADGSVFVLGFRPDYYLSEEFSIGGLFQLTPADDLTLLSAAGTASFHFDLDVLRVSPYVGLGLVWAELDRDRFSEDDTSYVVPLGATIEYPFSDRLSLGAGVAVNLVDLDFGRAGGDDDAYSAITAFIRYRP